MKWLKLLASLLALLPTPALADYLFNPGTTTTAFAFTCFSTKVCFAHTIINSAGTEIFTAGNPAQVTGANGTFPSTQSGTWNIGTVTTLTSITNPVAATQSGAWNITNITGTVSLPTGAATSANQTNKTQFTQLTDGTNAATTYTAYGTAPSGNVPGVNANVTNANGNPIAKRVSALSITVVQVKGTALATNGGLYLLQCGNTNASEAYVQVFSVPSASVTLGTTAPDYSVPIAATSTGGFSMAMPIQFTGGTNTGLSVAATTTATGSTALGAALDCNVAYN